MNVLSRFVAPVLLVLSLAALPVGSARAVGDLVCTVASETSFNPALKPYSQQTHVTFSADYNGCISLSRPDITSGLREGSYDGPRSCLALPPNGQAQFTVVWNTNEVSVVDGTTQSVDVAGQTVHTITGTVLSGPFAGRTYIEEVNQLSLSLLNCLLGPGIPNQTGIGVVTIN